MSSLCSLKDQPCNWSVCRLCLKPPDWRCERNVSGEKSAFSSMTANVTAAQIRLGATIWDPGSAETQNLVLSLIRRSSRSCITARVNNYSFIWKVVFSPTLSPVIRFCFSITSLHFPSWVLDNVKQRLGGFRPFIKGSRISVLFIVTSSLSCDSAQLWIQMEVVPSGWPCTSRLSFFFNRESSKKKTTTTHQSRSLSVLLFNFSGMCFCDICRSGCCVHHRWSGLGACTRLW